MNPVRITILPEGIMMEFDLILSGIFQSGQMGQTVNLLAFAFGGSNPSVPTCRMSHRSHAEVAQSIEH